MTEGFCMREDHQTLLELFAKSTIPLRRKENSRTFHTELTEPHIKEIIGNLRYGGHGECRCGFSLCSL